MKRIFFSTYSQEVGEINEKIEELTLIRFILKDMAYEKKILIKKIGVVTSNLKKIDIENLLKEMRLQIYDYQFIRLVAKNYTSISKEGFEKFFSNCESELMTDIQTKKIKDINITYDKIMKIGRNDKCWCGSGMKYKACHMSFDNRIKDYWNRGYEVPDHSMIKTPEQIEGIREAGKKNTMVLDFITPYVKEGVSTGELNRLIEEYTREIGGIPACLGYQGYPKSVCISIDDVVCHGIPSDHQILKSGQILNVDCTTIYNGYFGDASRMFCIGDVSEEKKKLVRVTKECVDLALAATKPWGTMGDMGYVCNKHAVENGYSVVREIGGHGCGVQFHEEPWVNHIGQPDEGILFVPGMTFTIEPMVNMGKPDVWEDEDDGWTIRTEDGKPSAQWEYTILVTEDGTEILSH